MNICRFLSFLAALFALTSCKVIPPEAQVTPSDPEGLVAEQLTSRSARLSWAPAADAEAYYVFARQENDAYYTTPAATLPAGSGAYEFTGLTPGTGYYFGVQAVGKGSKTFSRISYSTLLKLID